MEAVARWVLALLLLPTVALAQDYRLPPSMKGRPEAAKPDVDYRLPGSAPQAREAPIHQLGGPYVKVRDLRCSIGYSNGVASGQVENISKQALNYVELVVSWGGGGRHRPIVLSPMPMKPGDRIAFHSSGTVNPAGGKDCRVNVTVR